MSNEVAWPSINFHPEDEMYLIIGSGECNSDPALVRLVPYREVLEVMRSYFGEDGDGQVPYYDTFMDEEEWTNNTLHLSGEDFDVTIYEIAVPVPQLPEEPAGDALLPCPFCGSTSLSLENLVDEDDFSVECEDCQIQQIANYTRAEAIRRWNKRAVTAPAADRSETERLEQELAAEERVCELVIKERDDWEERLTVLADAVGEHFRVDVGEWSSDNDPDRVAFEVLQGGYKTDSDTDRKLAAADRSDKQEQA